jgi:hypothetical protein
MGPFIPRKYFIESRMLFLPRETLTYILRCILMEIQQQANVDQNPIPKLDEHSRKKHKINQHRRQEQRQKRPLVIIVRHISRRPSRQEIHRQTNKFFPKGICQIRCCVPTPPAIGPIGNYKTTELRDSPRNE